MIDGGALQGQSFINNLKSVAVEMGTQCSRCEVYGLYMHAQKQMGVPPDVFSSVLFVLFPLPLAVPHPQVSLTPSLHTDLLTGPTA